MGCHYLFFFCRSFPLFFSRLRAFCVFALVTLFTAFLFFSLFFSQVPIVFFTEIFRVDINKRIMSRAALNISWEDHPTKRFPCGPCFSLLKITNRFKNILQMRCEGSVGAVLQFKTSRKEGSKSYAVKMGSNFVGYKNEYKLFPNDLLTR